VVFLLVTIRTGHTSRAGSSIAFDFSSTLGRPCPLHSWRDNPGSRPLSLLRRARTDNGAQRNRTFRKSGMSPKIVAGMDCEGTPRRKYLKWHPAATRLLIGL